MSKEEALFFVALLLFVGIVIYEKRQHPIPDVEVAASDPAPSPVGPTYLTYNAPYRFGPPMQNVMPYSTAGMQGQVADVNADCGCSGAQQKW